MGHPAEATLATQTDAPMERTKHVAEPLERERAMREEVEILYHLTDAVNRASDQDSLFAPMLDAVIGTLHVERASILLFDPDRVMRFKAWRGLSDAYRATVEGHTPWTPETTDAEAVLVEDVETDESLASYRAVFRAERIRSLGFFPIVDGRRVIGKFMVYDASPRHYSAHEIRIANTIGSHVGQGVARLRAFEEAERQRLRAEEAARAKDEFLATISHELRTPLTAIVGWTHMLKTGAVSEDRREHALDTIERNARAQAVLIEDLLDYSRITTGRIKLNVSCVELAHIVAQAVDSIRPSANAKGLHLEVEIASDVGWIPVDPDRFQQIVWNLLANAVKFTPRGGSVRISVKRSRTDVSVSVSDTGKGIDALFLPHVFDRFRQGEPGETRSSGGLGLGLAIVRYLVEQHGGAVFASSDGAGTGSTFWFTLPIEAPPATVPQTS